MSGASVCGCMSVRGIFEIRRNFNNNNTIIVIFSDEGRKVGAFYAFMM